MNNDFRKFAVHHLGMNGLALDQYTSQVSDSYISPTIIEERKLNVAQMDVFSRLMMDRIIFLGTQVDDYTANVIQAQLLYLDSSEPGKDVSIYINSPGGSVSDGMAIYDTMNFIKSDVSTICIGMCASMASVLLASGHKGKRYILPNSEVMIHQPLGGVNGQATEIKIVADRILYLRNKLNNILAEKTGKELSIIEEDTERDHYLSSDEALSYGLVDKIL